MRSSHSVSPPLARPRGSAIEPAARRPGAPRASHHAEASSGPRVYRPGEYPSRHREHSRGRISARYVPYFKIMVLGFLALTVAGGLALALPFASADHARTSLIDAFFTAASAASGTGLVVRDTHDAWSTPGQMTILTLVQVGGIGFMAMSAFLLLLVRDHVHLSDPLVAETVGDTDRRHFVWFVLGVVAMTLVIEAIGAYVFYHRFHQAYLERGLFQAVFYAVSSFNNSGFDLEGNFQGIGIFGGDQIVMWNLAALLIAGALGVPLIAHMLSRRPWASWSLDTKMALAGTAIVLALGTLGVYVFQMIAGSSALPGNKLFAAFFTVAAGRTGGFGIVNMAALATPAILFVMMAMFIGGSSGSTAGGVKVNTIGTLVATALSYMRGERRAHAFGKVIPEFQVHRAVTIVFLFAAFIFAIALALSATEAAGFRAVLFETVSAATTTGYTFGITPTLTVAGKALIITAMLVGKLGPLTIVLALSRHEGSQRERHETEEAVHVG